MCRRSFDRVRYYVSKQQSAVPIIRSCSSECGLYIVPYRLTTALPETVYRFSTDKTWPPTMTTTRDRRRAWDRNAAILGGRSGTGKSMNSSEELGRAGVRLFCVICNIFAMVSYIVLSKISIRPTIDCL